MLRQRVITALILLPLVLALVFFAPLRSFGVILGMVLLIAAWEWAQLAGAKSTMSRTIFVVIIAALECVVLAVSPPMDFWPSLSWPVYSGEIPITLLMASAAFWIFSPVLIYVYPNQSGWWRRHAVIRYALGTLQILSVWVGLVSLRRIGYDNDELQGALLIFFVLLLVWAADTGAYIVGRATGKHKLAPAVSPGKTWEGFFGGLVLALTVGASIAHFYPLHSSSEIGLMAAILATVLASVAGDLMESLAKREAGIKDSGTIFPGHGGMLDRIDSLMAAVPVFALAAMLLDLH